MKTEEDEDEDVVNTECVFEAVNVSNSLGYNTLNSNSFNDYTCNQISHSMSKKIPTYPIEPI